MHGYESFVSELESGGLDAVHAQHEAVHEEGKEAMTTRLMLALRTREGIDLSELRDNYGEALVEAAAMACRDAAAELPSLPVHAAGLSLACGCGCDGRCQFDGGVALRVEASYRVLQFQRQSVHSWEQLRG